KLQGPNPKIQNPNPKKIPNFKGTSCWYHHPERIRITQPRVARNELPWDNLTIQHCWKSLPPASKLAWKDRKMRWDLDCGLFLGFGFWDLGFPCDLVFGIWDLSSV